MDGFTIIDVAVALVIILSAILAHSRGIVREVMAIGGWILAAILAFALAPVARPLVTEIPVLSNYLTTSCELSIIVSAFAVFAVALLVVSFFTPVLSGAVRDSALGPADQAAGFLFGAVRGIVLVAVAFVVYEQIAVTQSIASVENSRSARIVERSAPAVQDALPSDAPGWIVGRYEGLIGVCG